MRKSLLLEKLLARKYHNGRFLQNGGWSEYLESLGCERHDVPKAGMIVCPEAYMRTTSSLRWVSVPEEIAIKVLTLGYFP